MTERAWHVRSAEDTATELHVDVGVGLGDAEAATRLVTHGPNALVAAKPPSAIALLVRQLRSLLVGLLVAAGVDVVRLSTEDHVPADGHVIDQVA